MAIPPPPPGFSVIPPPPPGFSLEEQQPYAIDSTPGAVGGVGPTNRQIPTGETGLGQTARAAAAYIPGSDYALTAGAYGVDRLPQALGGTAPGQERTWQQALDDTRSNRDTAAAEEPGAALLGALATTRGLPWAKGAGVVPALKRALQAAGLTSATEYTRGKDAGSAAESGLEAGGVSAAIEGGLHLPGALRAVGRVADRAATRAGWRTAEATPAQAQAVAESLDPLGVSGADQAGEFLKNAKLNSGEFVVGGSAKDTHRRLQQYIAEWGAKKGALVDAAEARGAQVDVGSILSEARSLSEELDSPAMNTFYPEAKVTFDKILARLEKNYGVKQPKFLGIGQRGVGAQVVEPTPAVRGDMAEGVSMATDPVPSQPVFAPPQVTAMPRDEKGRILKAVHKGDNLPNAKAAAIKLNPESAGNVKPSGLQPGFEVPRLIPGTMRPNPNSGHYPIFEEAPPPKTVNEWEDLKTLGQTLVHETSAGRNRSDAAIDSSPVLQKLRGLASKIKSADEAAINTVSTPEEYAAFMEAKKNYGTGSELGPLVEKALRNAETLKPGNPAYEAERTARMMPWILGLSSSAPGAATGNVGAAILSGAAGYGVGRVVNAVNHANPTMTRVYDSIGRNLGKAKGPNMDLDPQVAALLAFLRNQQQETP